MTFIELPDKTPQAALSQLLLHRESECDFAQSDFQFRLVNITHQPPAPPSLFPSQ